MRHKHITGFPGKTTSNSKAITLAFPFVANTNDIVMKWVSLILIFVYSYFINVGS